MQEKQCTKCLTVKPLADFHKDKKGKLGRVQQCKVCVALRSKKYNDENRELVRAKGQKYSDEHKVEKKEYDKRYRDKNQDRLLKQSAEYREKTRGKYSEYHKQYAIDNEPELKEYRDQYYLDNKNKILAYQKQYAPGNKEKISIRTKQWREENRELINKKTRDRIKNNIQVRITVLLRGRLGVALKSVKAKKHFKALDLLGCDVSIFIKHIEKQFQPGMSWDKLGKKGIHIDHVRPCASFDLTDPQQQKECFHYSNLQPLWWYDNLSKGAKYDPPHTPT